MSKAKWKVDLFKYLVTFRKVNEKRKHKVLSKKCRYDVRKTFADMRLRVKGRFLKKGDEDFLREFVFLTYTCLL